MNRNTILLLAIGLSALGLSQTQRGIAQNSFVAWSAFDMGFEVTAAPNLQLKSALGQSFVGVAQQSDTRVECGFLADTLLRGILVGVNNNRTLPTVFSLEQNYPNPFNPLTVIRYSLPVRSQVRLEIYNVLGQVVKTLVEGIQEPGELHAEWDAGNASSGVYFYRIGTRPIDERREGFSDVKKMVVLR